MSDVTVKNENENTLVSREKIQKVPSLQSLDANVSGDRLLDNSITSELDDNKTYFTTTVLENQNQRQLNVDIKVDKMKFDLIPLREFLGSQLEEIKEEMLRSPEKISELLEKSLLKRSQLKSINELIEELKIQ